MKNLRARGALLFVAATLTAACAQVPGAKAPAAMCGGGLAAAAAGKADDAAPWVRTEIYFGLSREGGAEVSDAEFRDFVAAAVCPLFPAGFTLVAAEGQWRDEKTGRGVSEPSRLLILIRHAGGGEDAKIDLIRARYRQRFNQQSVLRVDQAASVSFE